MSFNYSLINVSRRLVKHVTLITILLSASSIYAEDVKTRVVSIGSDVTEIIFALGAGDKIVARDTTSTEPSSVLSLPDIGYIRQLSAEGILSQNPDLVIASLDASPANVIEQIKSANIPVVSISAEKNIEEIREKIEQVGEALDKSQEAEALIQAFDNTLAEIKRTPLDLNAVFILTFGNSQPNIAGTNSTPDVMFNFLGVKNAASSITRYSALSAENITALNPDVIVTSTKTLETIGAENFWNLPGIMNTEAGKQKRLIVVDDNSFVGFSLKTPQTLKQLRKELEAIKLN